MVRVWIAILLLAAAACDKPMPRQTPKTVTPKPPAPKAEAAGEKVPEEPPFPRKNGNEPACDRCDGTGVARYTWKSAIPEICSECGGSGVNPWMGARPRKPGLPCGLCDGTGWKDIGNGMVQRCPFCGGTGRDKAFR